jgi:hypothetical protein
VFHSGPAKATKASSSRHRVIMEYVLGAHRVGIPISHERLPGARVTASTDRDLNPASKAERVDGSISTRKMRRIMAGWRTVKLGVWQRQRATLWQQILG